MPQEFTSENQAPAQTAPQNPVNVGRIDSGDDGDLPARSRVGGPGPVLPKFMQSAPISATKTAPRRSFFADEKDVPASSVALDGETFSFDPLSDEAREVYDTSAASLAELFGMSEVEFLKTEDFNSEQRRIKEEAGTGPSRIPVARRPALVDAASQLH